MCCLLWQSLLQMLLSWCAFSPASLVLPTPRLIRCARCNQQVWQRPVVHAFYCVLQGYITPPGGIVEDVPHVVAYTHAYKSFLVDGPSDASCMHGMLTGAVHACTGVHPAWETCSYPAYTAFICLNGLAFLFSLCAVCVMIFMPWLLQTSGGWRTIVIKWGMGHLALAIAFFLAAFAVAGLVTASANAPPYKCSILPCDQGGVLCQGSTFANVSRALNSFQGRCFQVWDVVPASQLSQAQYLPNARQTARGSSWDFDLQEFGFPIPASGVVTTSDTVCYYKLRELPLEDDETQSLLTYNASTVTGSNTICMIAPSNGSFVQDLYSSAGVPIFDVTESENMPAHRQPGSARSLYSLAIPAFRTVFPGDNETSRYYASACNSTLQQGGFTFVKLGGNNTIPWIYLVGMNSSEAFATPPLGVAAPWNPSRFHVTAFDPKKYVIYDELPFRCKEYDSCSEGQCATLCRYEPHNSVLQNEWYPGARTRRCFSAGEECNGYAVDLTGKYIMKNGLAQLGADSEVSEDHTTATQVESVVYVVLSLGFALNIGTIVWLWLQDCWRKKRQDDNMPC